MRRVTIHKRTLCCRRGSAMSLMIIVAVVVTGLVMSIAWSMGLQTQAAGNRTKTDEAFYAADGAIQYAVGQFKTSPTWPALNLPKTVIVNNWSCAISYTDLGPSIGMSVGVLGNPLKFTVKATKTGVTAGTTISAKTTGILSYAPQFWTSGNLAIAESAHINGDVQTNGILTINPPSSGNVITGGASGIWKAKGNIVNNNPSGSAYFVSTPAANVSTLTAPSMTASAVFAALKAGSTIPITSVLTTNPATGNPMIDFSLAGGKPVYIGGSAAYIGGVDIKNSSNPSADTLMIDGAANFAGTFPANQTGSATMNLAINGDVSFAGTGTKGVAINGSFYVSGAWSQSGVYSFVGNALIDQGTTLAGTGTVGTATPPSFDPRYTPKITGYYGALP